MNKKVIATRIEIEYIEKIKSYQKKYGLSFQKIIEESIKLFIKEMEKKNEKT